MAEKIQLPVRLEPEGPVHSVTVVGIWALGRAGVWMKPEEKVSTDCGILLRTPIQFNDEDRVSCDDCLWGFLDPLVKAVVLEPIAV